MSIRNTDKKIRIQQKIIEQLEQENACLKEQLKANNPEHTKKTIALATQSHEEYVNLIRDLTQLKEEYQELIQAVHKDKKKLLKNCI